MISLTTTTTRKDDDDFSSSSSSFADNRRHHHRDDARYDGREKKRTGRTRWRRKRTRASEGTRRVFMNREKTTRLIERLDVTKIQREGTPLNDFERLSRSDAVVGRPLTILRRRNYCGNLYYTRRGDENDEKDDDSSLFVVLVFLLFLFVTSVYY